MRRALARSSPLDAHGEGVHQGGANKVRGPSRELP